MPAVNVDCSFLRSNDTFKICQELGTPDAAIYPIRLWCYGIESDCRDGIVALTPARLAWICEWSGDANVLWNVLTNTAHNVLAHVDGENYYMRGWRDRNARYFENRDKARERMRRIRGNRTPVRRTCDERSGERATNVRDSHAHAHAHAHDHDPDQIARDQKKPTLVQVQPFADGSESGETENLGGLSPQTPRTVADAPARVSGRVSLEKKSSVERSEAAPVANRSDEVLAVFMHYREKHPRCHPRPSSKLKEWHLIRARLEEGYSVADLKEAIDGQHVSKFHLGENDRSKQYLSLELAMRDSKHVADFIETLHTPLDISREVKCRFDLAAMDVIMQKHWAAEDGGQSGAF